MIVSFTSDRPLLEYALCPHGLILCLRGRPEAESSLSHFPVKGQVAAHASLIPHPRRGYLDYEIDVESEPGKATQWSFRTQQYKMSGPIWYEVRLCYSRKKPRWHVEIEFIVNHTLTGHILRSALPEFVPGWSAGRRKKGRTAWQHLMEED